MNKQEPNKIDQQTMAEIDWNEMSKLGLIERINKEILHPLGLAMTRDPDDGISRQVLVALDGKFEYSPSMASTILSDEELNERIEAIRSRERDRGVR